MQHFGGFQEVGVCLEMVALAADAGCQFPV